MKPSFLLKCLSALLVVALCCGCLLPVSGEMENATDSEANLGRTYTEGKAISIDWDEDLTAPFMDVAEKVAETDDLALYFRARTAEIAVENKATGDVWYSNPQNWSEDSRASNVNKSRLRSQFLLSYYTASGEGTTLDSFSECISEASAEKELIKAVEVDNGVKVTYFIGNAIIEFLYPTIISAERLESFKANMDEEQQALIDKYYSFISLSSYSSEDKKQDLLDTYPSLSEENDLYKFRETKSKSTLKKLNDAFKAAGYTEADLELDNQENHVEGSDEPSFTLSIVYQLDGDNLLAYMPASDIEYMSKYPPYQIDFLPYMGAQDSSHDGYLLVPDGSGALINFNNGKTGSNTYVSRVYGRDNAYEELYRAIDTMPATLPVFGIKNETSALLGIVDDGESMAAIVGDISGKVNSYNRAHARFLVLATDILTSTTSLGNNKMLLVEDEMYSGDFCVRYAFLDEENASYSGMARRYQAYLTETGAFDSETNNGEVPFFVNFMGLADKTKNFLGVPYTGEVALTTFDQAQEILQKLKDDGVGEIVAKYTGWMNGGLRQRSAMNLKVEKSLGGEDGLQQLMTYCGDQGIALYPEVKLTYVYADKWFDGFSSTKQAIRSLANEICFAFQYGVVTNYCDTNRPFAYLLKTSELASVVSSFTAQYDKLGIAKTLSMGDITSELSSDFRRNDAINRQISQNYTMDALKQLTDADYSLMAGNGINAYALGYTDYVVNLPITSNQFLVTDESVPFIQLVLNGHISYAATAFNSSASPQKDILKMIETDSGLYVDWIYEDNSVLKQSPYDNYFCVNYLDSYDRVLEAYQEVEQALSQVSGAQMVAHDKVADQVYQSTYSNGKAIIVNYNDKEVTVGGITVGAQSYVCVEGGVING